MVQIKRKRVRHWTGFEPRASDLYERVALRLSEDKVTHMDTQTISHNTIAEEWLSLSLDFKMFSFALKFGNGPFAVFKFGYPVEVT